jgi:hypothetical protein
MTAVVTRFGTALSKDSEWQGTFMCSDAARINR